MIPVEIKTGKKAHSPVYDTFGQQLQSPVLNILTFLMYCHHHRPVFRVDVEQGGGSHQVLRQVAQQWHCPANTIYTVYMYIYSMFVTVLEQQTVYN